MEKSLNSHVYKMIAIMLLCLVIGCGLVLFVSTHESSVFQSAPISTFTVMDR